MQLLSLLLLSLVGIVAAVKRPYDLRVTGYTEKNASVSIEWKDREGHWKALARIHTDGYEDRQEEVLVAPNLYEWQALYLAPHTSSASKARTAMATLDVLTSIGWLRHPLSLLLTGQEPMSLALELLLRPPPVSPLRADCLQPWSFGISRRWLGPGSMVGRQPVASVSACSPGSASPTSDITALSGYWDQMEVWFVAPNGALVDYSWTQGQPWQSAYRAPAGSASTSTQIAAVSLNYKHIEIWFVTPNGGVMDYYFSEEKGRNSWQFIPDGVVSQDAGLSAVSRADYTMEVYVTRKDGSIHGHYWYSGQGWKDNELSPPGTAALAGRMKIISRASNTMELWFIGSDGSIKDFWWQEEHP
ncbi:hypothetical protein VHEMI08883 [[Torrubiella] hemipterigena]|uniref:Fucose-specific lectin n=1 Tax=[Torrubiella] hemipterigena TaxID=1531966 RepID=A0A0A1TEW5_9HYPO|nr:hypothetical protein VHEMI08883 [[Torrubiella] hemipterigena]